MESPIVPLHDTQELSSRQVFPSGQESTIVPFQERQESPSGHESPIISLQDTATVGQKSKILGKHKRATRSNIILPSWNTDLNPDEQ